MSQALFSIILGFFHLNLPSVPYTSFVNDGHRVESSIVTLFSVKPLGEWKGFEPNSHPNETQIINSLSLWLHYSEGWWIQR